MVRKLAHGVLVREPARNRGEGGRGRGLGGAPPLLLDVARDDVDAERALAVHLGRRDAGCLERHGLAEHRRALELDGGEVAQRELALAARRPAEPHNPAPLARRLDGEAQAGRAGVRDLAGATSQGVQFPRGPPG